MTREAVEVRSYAEAARANISGVKPARRSRVESTLRGRGVRSTAAVLAVSIGTFLTITSIAAATTLSGGDWNDTWLTQSASTASGSCNSDTYSASFGTVTGLNGVPTGAMYVSSSSSSTGTILCYGTDKVQQELAVDALSGYIPSSSGSHTVGFSFSVTGSASVSWTPCTGPSGGFFVEFNETVYDTSTHTMTYASPFTNETTTGTFSCSGGTSFWSGSWSGMSVKWTSPSISFVGGDVYTLGAGFYAETSVTTTWDCNCDASSSLDFSNSNSGEIYLNSITIT